MKRYRVRVELTEAYDMAVDAQDEYDADNIAASLSSEGIRIQGEFIWEAREILNLDKR